jgi:hypothetical protein
VGSPLGVPMATAFAVQTERKESGRITSNTIRMCRVGRYIDDKELRFWVDRNLASNDTPLFAAHQMRRDYYPDCQLEPDNTNVYLGTESYFTGPLQIVTPVEMKPVNMMPGYSFAPRGMLRGIVCGALTRAVIFSNDLGWLFHGGETIAGVVKCFYDLGFPEEIITSSLKKWRRRHIEKYL